MDSLNVLVILFAVIGGVLVTDIGGFRSRVMRNKAESDAERKGLAGSWVGADAGADALQRRYNVGAITFGWIFIACSVGVFVTQLR